MSELLKECERRLRGGVPLRLDQITGLMEEGIDASMVEQDIAEELDGDLDETEDLLDETEYLLDEDYDEEPLPLDLPDYDYHSL